MTQGATQAGAATQAGGSSNSMATAAVASQANLGASALVSTANTAQSHTITHSNGSTKTMFNRTVPEDRAKAAGVVQQLMSATSKYADVNVARAEGFEFLPAEGDLVHAKNPQAKNGVNLDEPNMLLYRKSGDSYELIGAVLMSRDTAPDLGMGEWHVHDGHRELMKHVWFLPNNLDAAFNESAPKR